MKPDSCPGPHSACHPSFLRFFAGLLFASLAITPGQAQATTYDANSLTITTSSGDSASTLTVPGATNGDVIALNADAENDSITVELTVATTGEHALSVRFYNRPENTGVRLAINGIEHGPLHDGYAAVGTFVSVDYGKVLLAAGTHQLTFTATGHHLVASTFGIVLDSITVDTLSARTDITTFATLTDALNSGLPLYAPPGNYALPPNFTPSAPIDILGSVAPANRPVFTVANPSLLPASHSMRFQGIRFVGATGNNNKLLQVTTQQFDMASFAIFDSSFENCTPIAWATHPSIEGQIIRRLESRRFSVSGANRGFYVGGRVDDYDITDFTVADCGRFGVCVGPSGKGIDETIESLMKRGTVARGTISGTIMDTEFNHNQLILSGNNVLVADMQLLNMVLPPDYYTNPALATSYPLDSEPFYTKVETLIAKNIYIENDGAYQAMWGNKGASGYDEFPISPEGRDAIATDLTFVNTGVRRAVGVWHQTHGTNVYRNVTMHNRTNDAMIIKEGASTGTVLIENWVDINPPAAVDFPGVRNKSRENLPPAPTPVVVTIANSPTLTEYPSSSLIDAESFDFDANSLPFSATSGDAITNFTLVEATNGNLRLFNADAAGDFLTFQIDVPTAGNYGIEVRYYLGTNRGIYQLAIDGTNAGAPQDIYGSGFVTVSLGERALTKGNHAFTFTAVGKNPSSSSYRLGLDLVKLVRLGASTSPAPTGLNAVAPSSTAVTLEWIDNSNTETAFVIERQDNPSGDFIPVGTVAPNTITYTDNGLTAAASYSYRVAAILTSGNANYSNVATATTQPPPSTTSIIYDANSLGIITSSGESVTNLPQSTGNNGNIRVFNANGVDDFITFRVNVAIAGEYRVAVNYFRNQNRGIYQLSIDGTDIGSPTDHYGSGAVFPVELGQRALSTGNHQFTFRVVGKDPAATDYRLGLDTIVLSPVIVPPPAAPTTLQATASAESVDLVWTAPAGSIGNYTLQRRSGGNGVFATIATPNADTATFQDIAISPGATYTYRISATNTGGTSAFSNETTATTPTVSGPPSTNFDANSLAVFASSGESILSVTNTAASGGDFVRFDSNNTGDFLSFTVQVPATAIYGLEAIFHRNAFRGIAQLKIDGVAHGTPQDLYSANAGFLPVNLPEKFLTEGAHTFIFEIVGKNAAASDYQFGIDRLVLTALDLPLPIAPEITLQPVDMTAPVGSTVTFTVAVTGSPAPTYQWRFDGTEIPGATEASFTLDSASFANSGSYEVIVANLAGSITSQTVQLTVTKAPAGITLSGLTATYDGTPHTVTAQTAPAGLNVIVSYNGSPAAPIDVGNYAVNAVIADDAYTGSASTTLVIAPASATLTLGDLRQAYDGGAKSVTVTTAPTGLAFVLTYDGATTAPTLPGRYEIDAAITAPNYTGFAQGELIVSTAALVRRAPTLNGDIDGSVQVLTGENVTLNGGASIAGNLLVPGTPTMRLNGQPLFGGTQDSTGATTPASYQITLNGNAALGHVVRRVDPITMPVVAAPLAPAGTRSVSINAPQNAVGDFATLRNLTLNSNVGAVAVPAGAYGNFTANNGTSFVFGVAGATEPSVYHLQALTLNSNAQLTIVGPVILNLATGPAINGQAGSATHPEWLQLNVAAGNVTINGNATLNAHIIAPASTVTINGTLTGEVTSDRLTINGQGLIEQKP